MKKVLGSILLVVYSIIAITVTILLLSYNEYNCSEIGDYTVYIVRDDSLEPEYKQGSILLIRRTSDKNIQQGDSMFFYKVINSQEFEFVEGTLDKKIQQGNHITYVIDNGENYDSSYFVGKTSDTKVIEGWGFLLSLLESKWGYLFCVVIVSLLLFLQEVFELSMEIKYGRDVKKARQAGTSSEAEAKVVEAPKTAKTSTSSAKKTTSKPKTTNTTKTTTSRTATKTTAPKSGAPKSSTVKSNTTRNNVVKSNTTKKSVKDEKEANSEEE